MLIVFDLDGVLVDSREMHYDALNRALQDIAPNYVISREDHLAQFDGLSTTKKLILLGERGLDPTLYRKIWQKKQEHTEEIIRNEYTHDDRVREILRALRGDGHLIYVASNSIRSTMEAILDRKGFKEFVDYFASNQEVRNPKPNPEIYFHCMIQAGVTCQETIIIEDSPIGRRAAIGSGAHLLTVDDCSDLTLEKIQAFISCVNAVPPHPRWSGRCNVVIPMSGAGSRFAKAGYVNPKPFIDVNGKPMIQVVVENLNLDPQTSRFIFIVQLKHMEMFGVEYLLKLIAPGCVIIPVDGITEGAACSVLLAEGFINNDEHLLIANSDQYVEWDSSAFMYSMISDYVDGGITTFKANETKWSYARLGDGGLVAEVAEKKVISDNATVGIYYWKKGADFVRYAHQMIKKDIRVNNEFYVCPVFNEAIGDKKKIKIWPVTKMHGIGTPEDLRTFLDSGVHVVPDTTCPSRMALGFR